MEYSKKGFDRLNIESQKNFQDNTVFLPDGTRVSAVGKGTCHAGDAAAKETKEIKAFQLGVEIRMTLIDAAEMYGERGKASWKRKCSGSFDSTHSRGP